MSGTENVPRETQGQELTSVIQEGENNITQVISRALSMPDFNPDNMIKLLDMQERVMAKQAEMSFNADFALMQNDLPVIEESGKLVHGGKLISTYAKFEDINEQVRPVLARYGFSISFDLQFPEKACEIRCILSHREGHKITTTMTLPFDTSGSKNNVQAIGSTISYGKRYAIMAMLNLSSTASEDNDADGLHEKVSEEQAANIEALVGELKLQKGKMFHFFSQKYGINIAGYPDFPVEKYSEVIAEIEKYRK